MSAAFDVVVVGGRVAGASTALLLARAGLRVAVLERSSYGSDTLSTHGLMRAGVLQLSRWGVLDAVRRAGTPPVRRTSFFFADAPPVHVTLRSSPGVEALYAPRRSLLDRVLVDAAADAGADVRHDVAVTGLVDTAGRVGGVQGVDAADRPVEVRSDFVVGADGMRSTVARAVQAPVLTRSRNASAVLYRYYEDLPVTGYEWGYGGRVAAGLIPTNDGRTCVFVGADPARLRLLRSEGTDVAFATLLDAAAPEHHERVRAARPAGPLRGWRGEHGFVRQPWGAGWALVGDAGYFKDPLSTHGMTDALRDAELLARALVQGVGGQARERAALAAYDEQRTALSEPLFRASDAVAGYDWDTPTLQRLLREMSAAMSDEVELLEGLPREAVPVPVTT